MGVRGWHIVSLRSSFYSRIHDLKCDIFHRNDSRMHDQASMLADTQRQIRLLVGEKDAMSVFVAALYTVDH